MCEPATLAWITLAVTTASTAYSIDAQNKTNDAMAEAAEIGYEYALDANEAEARAQASEVAKQARIDRGRILAAAAESGVGGQAVLDQLRASLFNQGFDTARIDYNRSEKDKQAFHNRENAKAGLMAPNVWQGLSNVSQASYQVADAYKNSPKNNNAGTPNKARTTGGDS